jgi:hypothetical protein
MKYVLWFGILSLLLAGCSIIGNKLVVVEQHVEVIKAGNVSSMGRALPASRSAHTH